MAPRTKRLRRPGEPQRPRPLSAQELETAGPEKLEKAIKTHAEWSDKLLAADDPGRGLPPAQAQAARQTQLQHLQEHTVELTRLRGVWEATSPEGQREAALWQRLQNVGRRKQAHQATSPEAQAALDQAHEALRAAERERKTREKLAALRERLLHPPSADAPELIGAVLMQPELLEALEHRLREDQDGTWTATHQLEPLEVGVLVTCLHLMREVGSIEISGMSTSARWPKREPPLVATPGLRDALLQLRRQRLLAFSLGSDTVRVTYGDRIRELATEWGLVLPST